MIVEEKGDKERGPKIIDGDEQKVNEPQSIPLSPMKIPPPFL